MSSEERISLRKIGYRCVCSHNLKTFVFMGMQSSVREVVIVSFATVRVDPGKESGPSA